MKFGQCNLLAFVQKIDDLHRAPGNEKYVRTAVFQVDDNFVGFVFDPFAGSFDFKAAIRRDFRQKRNPVQGFIRVLKVAQFFLLNVILHG